MIVSSWNSEPVCKAHAAASSIFNAAGMGGIVSGIVHHAINGGAAFFVAPDGSKEGWPASEDAAKARADLIAALGTIGVDWALVLVGGDDGDFRVLDSVVGHLVDEPAE